MNSEHDINDNDKDNDNNNNNNDNKNNHNIINDNDNDNDNKNKDNKNNDNIINDNDNNNNNDNDNKNNENKNNHNIINDKDNDNKNKDNKNNDNKNNDNKINDNNNDNNDKDKQTESKINKEINYEKSKKEYYINISDMMNFTFLTKNDLLNYKSLLIYYKNKNILNEQYYLEKIIEELLLLVVKEYGTILFPFFSPTCEELLDAYIKSKLDEDKSIKSINDFKYIKIFEIMKNNNFISRGSISLIYSYFGSLFYDAKNIDENDERLSKFLKLKELWKIFYTLPSKDIIKNNSSFSFIGGKLIFEFKKKYDFHIHGFFIKINFLSNKYLDKNFDKIIFLKLNNQIIEVKKYLKKIKDIDNIIYMEFRIYLAKVELYYQILGKQVKKDVIKYIEIDNIETISILENYYGLIKSIEITLKNKELKEKSQILLYYPIPTTEKNGLCEINHIGQNNNIIDLTTEKKTFKFVIDDNNLIKVNYINYNEENYNIIEYFGGITQLLPFMSLIKNLFENEKIKLINQQNKNDILISFVTDILCSFINIIFYYNEYKINIVKYFLFFLYILSELDTILLSKIDKVIETINYLDDNIKAKYKVIINYFILFLKLERNEFINDLEFFIESYYRVNINDLFYNQLYTKLMKELFIYNRNWSKKDLFFNIKKNDNKITINYKQINYYTKSFQQPFIYPILEMNKYYPDFTGFSKDNLYKNKEKEILNYDFSLSDHNIIIKEIKKYIDKKQNIIFEKCCLVKKIYHVKGKIGILKRTEENKESFDIIFISNDNDEDFTCNKENMNIDKNNYFQRKQNEKNKSICYGSIFRCPKKEYNKKIIIHSENIIFLLIREYFHRVSALEIFTNNHKSYYFNFSKKFDVKQKSFFNIHKSGNGNNNDNDEGISDESDDENNNDDNNNIQNNINNTDIEKTNIKDIDNIVIFNIINNDDFIKIIKNKILLGFYNKKYSNYMFPLFEKRRTKIKYLSNFDILIFINLFSNRSFKDLYQYPVFPIFYEPINKKRIMNKHIGLQDIDPQSKARVDLINESYRAAYEDYMDNPKTSSPVRLFNTFFSNPIYVSNYLIRIFPYSFSCIELQGDGFDNPNRLFYSIDGSLSNTLSQKSDLRELIPELFYFFELFKNKNNLQLHKLANKKEIDTIKINNDNNDETDKDIYKFLETMRNILEKEEKLNEWIDLIFSDKKTKDEKKRDYYSKDAFVTFENNEKMLKNQIIMDSADFGLLPFKLFSSKFPVIKKGNIDKLKKYNALMIDVDHFVNKYNPMKCCMCIGRTNIDKDYLDFYTIKNTNKLLQEDISLINKVKNIDENSYYFIGDIFGNVTIYAFVNENKLNNKKNSSFFKRINIFKPKKTSFDISHSQFHANEQEKKEDWVELNKYDKSLENYIPNTINCDWENELNDFYKKTYDAKIDRISVDNIKKVYIFKKLYDHNKQVKYIDFNGRLNLFATYALDGFINLYLFPSCKLINTIKVTNIVGNCIFDKVLLVSTPFPMIICINEYLIYIFDINGNFIHVESLADEKKIQIHIDKNCGIVQDFISKNNKEYSFPFIDEIK